MAQAIGDGLQIELRKRDETTAWIGMLVFIAAWAMMFGVLFVVYAWLRTIAPAWPPEGQARAPWALPAVNTLVIALSSAMLERGKKPGALVLAALLGALFLGLQIVVWSGLWAQGLRPSTGSYASILFGFTWLHAAHVVVGLVALGYFAVKRSIAPAQALSLRLWTAYWHGVGVIWALVFVLVIVI